MAFVYADRVKETSVTEGEGNFTLDGAVTGFQSFIDGIGNNNQTYYTIINEVTDVWEVGAGTHVSGVLFRDAVLASTNSNMLVDFGPGPKTVIATIAGEFFATVLTLADHAVINHVGIPGVPLPEVFTESVHTTTDHTQPPFNLLSGAAHADLDHVLFPPSLMSAASHFNLSHGGISGVNDFDVNQHKNTDHSTLAGIPAAEAFTEAVHNDPFTDYHTGAKDVAPPVPSPDVVTHTVAESADASDTVDLDLTEGTWMVFAWAAWRTNNFNGNQLADSHLRIAGTPVSTIVGTDGNINGAECYAHFGYKEGVAGNQTVTCDFDARDQGSLSTEPRIRAFAFRTA